MAEYYLISQLPSLDGLAEGAPLPITEEAFLSLCRQQLKGHTLDALERLTLTPSPATSMTEVPLVRAWYEGEIDLRTALAKARAEKLNKPYETPKRELSPALCKVAVAALATENPLEAEKLLLSYRLGALEAQRPMDGFSEAYLFYYLLKLKLLARIRGFDAQRGVAAYQKIYGSILGGEELEVTE